MVLQLFTFLSLANATDCSTSTSPDIAAEQCRVQKETFEKKLNESNPQTSTTSKTK